MFQRLMNNNLTDKEENQSTIYVYIILTVQKDHKTEKVVNFTEEMEIVEEKFIC